MDEAAFDFRNCNFVTRRTMLRQTVAGVGALGVLGSQALARTKQAPPVRIRFWSEGTAPRNIYPDDIDGALGEDFRKRPEFQVTQARLSDPDNGLSDAALDSTDVLVWWGRLRHDELSDARSQAVVDRVKSGRLGFIALHASHACKPFRALMGTACEPDSWRDDGQPEHIRVMAPDHPIAQGVEPFTIPQTAMYTEPFAVPTPETVVFVSSWNGGETFRSGLTWTIENGRIVYFRPGHDAFPILFHPTVRQVIANSALWAANRNV
jgi:trehalose utilization protein